MGSGSPPPKKKLDGPPQLFDEECDYRYVTHCSARNWVYHPYFVLYNNLDQGIGPPTLKTWLRPCARGAVTGNARSPKVDRRTGETIRVVVADKRSEDGGGRRRQLVDRRSQRGGQDGAVSLRQLI